MRFPDCAIIRPSMVQRPNRIVWMAAASVLASAIMLLAAEKRPARLVTTAYFSDSEIQVQPAIEARAKAFTYGPWTLGSIVNDDKASDHRFNLYVIVPGSQHQAPSPYDEF